MKTRKYDVTRFGSLIIEKYATCIIITDMNDNSNLIVTLP